MTVHNTGAAGGGFISGAVGPLLLVMLVLTALAIPEVREAVASWAKGCKGYFVPEHAPGVADSTASTEPAEESLEPSGRASDNDDFDFDLDLLDDGTGI